MQACQLIFIMVKFGSDEFEFTEDELGKPAAIFVSRRFRAYCDFFLNIRYLIQRSYLASYNICSRVPTDPQSRTQSPQALWSAGRRLVRRRPADQRACGLWVRDCLGTRLYHGLLGQRLVQVVAKVFFQCI